MRTFMTGGAVLAALVAAPARAETVSFDWPSAHVDFSFVPVQLVNESPVALPDGSWMQAVSGGNEVERIALNVQQQDPANPSWTTYGGYAYDGDGLSAQRFLDAEGGSRLTLTLKSTDVEIGYGARSTITLDYACACADLYLQYLDAALLKGRTPVSGEISTNWVIPGSSRDPDGANYTYSVSLPAVPEPATLALSALGLLAVGWRIQGSRRPLAKR